MKCQQLLSPGKIGNMELKNRIVLAAMGTEYAEKDGSCSERLWDYYEARAKGGTGLVILETSAAMWPNGSSMARMVASRETTWNFLLERKLRCWRPGFSQEPRRVKIFR